jgi:acylphosphatase
MIIKKAVKIYFSGRVQGVSFRNFVKKEADKIGLNGYVRNLSDGRVEAWFEGREEEIKEIIELCKNPDFAVVEDILVEEQKPQSRKEFKILHI